MTTAVPTQQKAKKAVPLSGERSNAAPSEATAGWIIQKGGARPMLFGQERKLFGLRSCRYFYPHGVFG